MSKNTINLGDILENLTSPMEKTAMMTDGKTDALESEKADVGAEKKVATSDEGKVYCTKKHCDRKNCDKDHHDKEDKQDYDKDYDKDLNKTASITEAAAKVITETPVAGLTKIAQDLAEQEHKTMVKEAQVFGSVMADSFANRLAEIQDVVDASDAPTMDKTAAEQEYETMEKVATELYVNMNAADQGLVNELCKVATEQGQPCTPEEAFSALADEALALGERAALEKNAADASEEVFTKLASDDHAMLEGFVKTAALMDDACTKEEAYNHMAKQAMEAGSAFAQGQNHAILEKQASEQIVENSNTELMAMEKVAAEMEANGDTEGVAALEKHAYEKGFEETLIKVASHTGTIGYAQTEQLMRG